MEKQIDNIGQQLTNILLLFEQRFDNLESRMESLENKVDKLIDNSENINESCSKMKGHINFVEETYTTVRAPLDFVKKNIEKLMGSNETEELPLIEYTQNNSQIQ